MADAEAQGPGLSYDSFVDQILRPTNFTSLKEPIGDFSIKVQVFRNPQEPQQPTSTFAIDNMYSFHTVSDLATRIYIESDENDDFHPENLCMLLKPLEEGKYKYQHLQYLIDKGKKTLYSPFELIKTNAPDSRFVDLVGNAKLMEVSTQLNHLLESALITGPKREYTIHLYLYRDIYQFYSGNKPVSRASWEGIFRVYFPERKKEHEDGSLTPGAELYKGTLVRRHTCRQKMLDMIDSHLQETPLRKPGESTRSSGVNFSNVRNLRFMWAAPANSPEYKPFDIESAFYDMVVSKEIPYIRYYPSINTPISKVHVEGPDAIPSLEVPDLLIQWSQMKSVTPEENVIMMKVLLRPGSGSVYPLYATVYVHQDGTVKCIIQPDANTKALTQQADLYDLSAALSRISKALPKLEAVAAGAGAGPGAALGAAPGAALAKQIYTPSNISLVDSYVILSLWLEKDDKRPITKKFMNTILPYYRPVFQVAASPLPFQDPIAFLRYKCVNNFQTPSRDFQFLHRILDLQKLDGQTNLPNLVKFYMDEFDVPEIVAQTRVKSFLEDLTKYELTNPVTMEYNQATNPGIDIAFFGKHPYYTIHMYRVDSITTLRRLKSLISLMISLEEEEFEEIRGCYKAIADEDKEQQEAADAEAQSESRKALEDGVLEPGEGVEAVAEASEAVADTLGEQGDAFAFDAIGDFAGFEDAEPVPNDTLAEGASGAPAQPALASLKHLASLDVPPEEKEEDEPEVTDPSQLKQAKAKTYFSQRLDLYDKRLFQYAEGNTQTSKYSTMCAANALKQPVVMSEEEYERMREIYEKDSYDKNTYEENKAAVKVFWVDYPLTKDVVIPAKLPSNAIETVTTLRYGSNLLPGQANIYICSQYWCRKDNIVVLRSDYESLIDRSGRPKDKNTCPFCHDGPVKDRINIVKGESVIERIVKSKSVQKKPHLFISFLGKTNHPEGLFLPCCFIKDHKIYKESHPAFKKQTLEEDLIGEDEADNSPAEHFAVDYKKKLSNNNNWYIVGSEKVPLEVLREGPQIGILSPELDKFFAQDSRDLVINDHTVWKLVSRNGKPNASGFLRIAVENKKRFQPESFLAAAALAFGENSAADMKTRITTYAQPLLFISLNYGNLIFDFFNPAIQDPDNMTLKGFSHKSLQIDSGVGLHKESLIRTWKAYSTFEAFMANPTKTKEFRQFSQLFTLPGILTKNGVLFIVLEVSAKGTVEMRCPPYGVNPNAANKCDIAFLLHYSTGAWEPVFYTDNDESEDLHESYVLFKREKQGAWPAAVKKRVSEYERMCYSSGLGMYTDSPSINSKTLLPLSVGMRIGARVHSILRDTYNHVSNIVFILDNGGKVMVPVIDDGTVYPTTRVELDWRNFMRELASATAAKEFYATKVAAVLRDQSREINASYVIDGVWRLDRSVKERDDMFALHLANGLIVPAKKPESGETFLESDFLQEGQDSTWIIDTKLVFGSKEKADKEEKINYKEFKEIFEHLRFTFANWLAVQPGAMKKKLNEILFRDIPLFEKRQRLFVNLQPVIFSWLDSSIPQKNRNPSLKRVDCRVIKEEDACSNHCVWRGQGAAAAAAEGSSEWAGGPENNPCVLHVPNESGDAKGLLLKKLVEELIRFPQKRNELLQNKVHKYTKLTKGFRSGDQFIVPEDSGDWAEMLRFEWRKEVSEEPKYYEEFASIVPQEESLFVKSPMPEIIVKYINSPKLVDKLGYFSTDSAVKTLEVLSKGAVTSAELLERGQPAEADFLITQELVDFVAMRTNTSIIQLMYETDQPFKPIIFVKTIVNDGKESPFFFIIKTDDDEVGFVSASKDTIEPIQYMSLPVFAGKAARVARAARP